mmetsp:Transcript_12490/g.12115  ORF Transcript_12490/g.12115 Transcript_12490/m.12115 type:complete len:344 (-) Transcript_12490:203-1234(-)
MATATEAVPVDNTASNSSSNNEPIIIDTQHDDMVHDAQMDYYGCKLATSSSDRTVKIYDVSGDSYTHTATLQGHGGPVWQVSWAHPKFGVVLASCSFDGSVLLHRESRPRDWTLVHAARQLHESSVNSVAFCPHEYGLICAAASSDGRVSILSHEEDDSWTVDYISDNSLGVNAVSWAPYNNNNNDPTTQSSLQLVTAGCDNKIRFYNRTATTTTTTTTTDNNNNNNNTCWTEQDVMVNNSELSHTDWVRDVAWAPSIVPNVNIVASCSEDCTVLIWKQEENQGNWEPTLLHTFDQPVWRVSWSVTGSILAVSSGDNSVTLWKAGLDGVYSQVSQVEDVASQQ